MTVLATDGQLLEGRIPEQSSLVPIRLRPSTMAGDTCCRYQTAESDIFRFVARRHVPFADARVVSERGLKQVVAALHQIGERVRTRAHHIGDLLSVAEYFSA